MIELHDEMDEVVEPKNIFNLDSSRPKKPNDSHNCALSRSNYKFYPRMNSSSPPPEINKKVEISGEINQSLSDS